jgi:hypothetical protein
VRTQAHLRRRSSPRPLFPLLAFAPLTVVVACGAPQTGPHDGRQPAASASASASGGAASGTRAVVVGKAPFVFFPGSTRGVGDSLTLDDGSTLYAMDGGVRFLAKGDPATYRSAESFVDDDLLAVRKLPGGKLAFLGASGSVYVADTPLGAFGVARTPPVEIRRAFAGKSAFFAITKAGALLRSADAGASWSPVSLRGADGRDAIVSDLAIDDAGNGLALLAPERLLETKDDGASFAPVPLGPAGVTRLARAEGGSVLLEAASIKTSKWGTSITSEYRALVRDGDKARLDAKTGLRKRTGSLPTPAGGELPLGYAESIGAGRGALIGATYLEVTFGDDETAPLSITRVELPSRTTTTLATPIHGCGVTTFAAAGSFYAIACTVDVPDPAGDGTRTEVHVWTSEDAGKAWKKIATLAAGEPPRLYATAKGALVLTGACLPSKDGCNGPSALVRPPGGAFRALRPDATHSWEVQLFASNAAGDRFWAYAVERNADLDEAKPVLLSTSDAGARVTAKPMPWTDATSESVLGLTVEEGATPALHLFGESAEPTRWTTRDDGAHFESIVLPFSLRSFAFAGARGVALGDLGAFETPDAGRTWGAVTLPDASSFACSEAGCLLGDAAFRGGWEIATAADAKPPKAGAPARDKPDAATAWKCTLEPTPTKRVLLREALGAAVAPRPGVAWLGAVADGPTGTAKVVEASVPSAGAPLAVTELPLFAAAQAGKGEPASTVRATPQGVFAVRYRFAREVTPTPPKAPPPKPTAPTAPTGRSAKPAGSATSKPASGPGGATTTPPKPADKPAHKVDVEIAWYAASTGKVVRGTIPAAEGMEPDAHLVARKGYFEAKATAWIAPGYGAVVRPFASRLDEPLWLISEAGKTTALPPLAEPSYARRVAVRGAGALHLVSSNENGGQLFVATLDDGAKAWKTRVIAAWPSGASSPYGARTSPFSAFSASTAGGAEPSIAFAIGGDALLSPHAWSLSLGGEGPLAATALPTQRDLSLTPRTCGGAAAERATAARVALPYGQGTRHPIVVADGAMTRSLATWDAIAELDRRAPEKACVAAFEASRPGYASGEWLSIDPAALDRALDVREVYESGTRHLELRKASCSASNELLSSFAGTPGMWR